MDRKSQSEKSIEAEAVSDNAAQRELSLDTKTGVRLQKAGSSVFLSGSP